jgi:hypothetical protein
MDGRTKGGPGNFGAQGLLPTPETAPFSDEESLGEAFSQDDSCKLITFNETFYFMSAVSRDPKVVVGQRYFFDNGLNRPDGSQIEDVTLSGVCTRTRKADPNGTAIGGGVCNWVIYHASGNWSMSASGSLESATAGRNAGSMAVTGGSGEMVSVMGEMDVWPIDINGMLELGDVFNSSYAYYVNAIYGLLICPNPYQISPLENTTAV